MSKKFFIFALLSLMLCGFSASSSVNFYVVSFKPSFKSCSSNTCTTYMESVIKVQNNSEYPVEVTLNCIYFMNDEPHSNVSSKIKLDIGENKTVTTNISFTTNVDDVSFYSISCELVD